MNDANMRVLVNVIGAVESGGQIYGRRNYSAYAAPFTNSNKEYTITLGWAQNYGSEAYKLVLMIYTKDPQAFEKIDPTGAIKKMINGEHDWEKERWNPNTYQRYVLLALIDSPAGHECQDELFAQLMKKYIADCEQTFTKDTKAIMMYCEIRHLGGKGPADRIFKRCNGDYSLDNIMTTLKKDQSDTSSSNQVGDKKFWSRHQKCREFIDKYAANEGATKTQVAKLKGSESSMGIVIGSARIDERGRAHGGKAGDQTGKEVSMQPYYRHKGDWYAYRFKNPEHAKRFGYAIKAACNNSNWGYNQYDRYSGMKRVAKYGYDPAKLDAPSGTDCSNLVRTCFIYATGKDPGDFDTSSEPRALEATGFVSRVSFNESTGNGLMEGDILVTRTKGHTAGVTDGPKRSSASTGNVSENGVQAVTGGCYSFDPTSIKRGSKGIWVLLFQEIFSARNAHYKWGQPVLALDSDCGPATEKAIRWYQKQRGLKVDGECGTETWDDLLSLPKIHGKYVVQTVKRGTKGTSVLLFQEVFQSRNVAWKWGLRPLILTAIVVRLRKARLPGIRKQEK